MDSQEEPGDGPIPESSRVDDGTDSGDLSDDEDEIDLRTADSLAFNQLYTTVDVEAEGGKETEEEEEEPVTEEQIDAVPTDVDDEDLVQQPTVSTKVTVRVLFPRDAMPALEAINYVRSVLAISGAVFIEVSKMSELPCAEYEIHMRELQFRIEIPPVEQHDNEKNRLISFLRRFRIESAWGFHNQIFLEILELPKFFPDIISHNQFLDVVNLAIGNNPTPGMFFCRGDYFSYVNNRLTNTNVIHDRPCGDREFLSYASFEHDRRKLAVYFACPLPEEASDGLAFAGFRLMLNYGNIMDVRVNELDKAFEINIRMKHPPQLWEVVPRSRQFNGRRTFDMTRPCDWMRVLSFPGNSVNSGKRHNYIGCTKETLATNHFLTLTFHLDNIPEHEASKTRTVHMLMNMLVRLTVRNPSIRIHFGAIFKMRKAMFPLDNYPQLNSFRADYALKAILDRGAKVMDELLDRNENRSSFFFKRLVWCMKECSAACEEALEGVLAALDEHRNITVVDAFDCIYANRAELYRQCAVEDRVAETTRFLPPNCILIRKVMVTPLRVLPMLPDVMMSNRIVRQFGAEYALRLVFRDDNGLKLTPNEFAQGRDVEQHCPIIASMVKSTMGRQVTICGRVYYFLAWSNSQMRDHGCYMYAESVSPSGERISIDTIREWMGDFTQSRTVPKLMSRMGQCFTQAQPTLWLERDEWTVEEDVVGGKVHPETGELYTFSDGAGRMSAELAQKVTDILELPVIPSCFQVRFKGFKGVLTVDRTLGLNGNPRVVFRKSQKKFTDSSEDEGSLLEVVKHSMPSPMCLNRPLITILDAVTEKQGKKCHRSMCGRILYFLESELAALRDMLLLSSSSADALSSRVSIPIDFKRLRHAGISFTDEPFFRQMLLAVYRYNITQHLAKAKLFLPPSVGRSMFGVFDDTGLLQYGQVFIQYSPGIRSSSDKPICHVGRVMVSKNPCHVAGDARMFDAVWQPALAHLIDVIVFPQYGPRPHPDEMAGSDLDGDEYSVVFDPEMCFHHNEEAMIFPKKTAVEFEHMPTTEDMTDFFLKYLQQDSIGKVSNAHLYMADKRGLFDTICDDIARKCSIAVDFPKTGEPADPLERHEQLEACPDFGERRHKPSYPSTRLNGILYRKVKRIEEVLQIYDRQKSIFEDNIDLTILSGEDLFSGDPEMRREVIRHRDRYAADMQQLIDEYGVGSEAAIVSGHMVNLKRLAAMEKDDYSFYNTDKIVQMRFQKMWNKFRKIFFEEFGDEEDFYETDNRGEKFLKPHPLMIRKARAWYWAAYVDETRRGEDDALRIHNRPCKSLPWIVWDVLAEFKKDERLRGESSMPPENPLVAALSLAIQEFMTEHQEEYGTFQYTLKKEEPELERYTSEYPSVVHLLFVLHNWFSLDGFYGRCPIRTSHVARLLIRFCLGHLQFAAGTHVSDAHPHVFKDTNSCFALIKDAGELLVNFLRYLGSDQFGQLQFVDLRIDGRGPLLVRPQYWVPLSQFSHKALHAIAVSGNFSALRLTGAPVAPIAEADDPVTVSAELFKMIVDGNNVTKARGIADVLKKWTGVTVLLFRPVGREYVVTIAGPVNARLQLARLLQLDHVYLRQCIAADNPPSAIHDELF